MSVYRTKMDSPMRGSALRITDQNAVAVNNQDDRSVYRELSSELRKWFKNESADWDTLVKKNSKQTVSEDSDLDLWDSIPTVDSKAVARTSPIFQSYLGQPLKVGLIRPGGYTSVDDMIGHLVPAMMDLLK